MKYRHCCCLCLCYRKKKTGVGGNFVMDSYAWIYVGVVGMHVFGGRVVDGLSDVCVCVYVFVEVQV